MSISKREEVLSEDCLVKMREKSNDNGQEVIFAEGRPAFKEEG